MFCYSNIGKCFVTMMSALVTHNILETALLQQWSLLQLQQVHTYEAADSICLKCNILLCSFFGIGPESITEEDTCIFESGDMRLPTIDSSTSKTKKIFWVSLKFFTSIPRQVLKQLPKFQDCDFFLQLAPSAEIEASRSLDNVGTEWILAIQRFFFIFFCCCKVKKQYLLYYSS